MPKLSVHLLKVFWLLGLLALVVQNPASGACYPLYGGVSLNLSTGQTGMRMNTLVVTGAGGANRAVSSYAVVDTLYPSLSALNPASFPAYCASGCPNVNNQATVAAGSYNTVNVGSTTTTFTGGTYYINTLVINNNRTAHFAAGTYYIKNFDMRANITATVSSGPVIFRIGTTMAAGNNFIINSAGTPGDLQVLLYPSNPGPTSMALGTQDNADGTIDFSGVVYTPHSNTSVSIGNNVDFKGAIIGAGTVTPGNGQYTTHATADDVLTALGGCIPEPAPVEAGIFNAVDSWASPSPQGDTTGRIFTKLAGVDFNLDIVALKYNGSTYERNTGFKETVSVELLNASNNSGNMNTTSKCRDTWVPIPGRVATLLAFTLADSGRKAVTLNELNAWPDVRVRVTYDRPGSQPDDVACSGDNFAIRPTAFSNLTANLGGATLKAGHNFTLTTTATVNSGYSGTPQVDNALVRDHNNATIVAAALLGSFSPATGQSSTGTYQYHDVGSLNFLANAVYDQVFTATDQIGTNPAPWPDDCVRNSTTNSLSAYGQYGCNIGLSAAKGPFGRFYPDHFALAATLTPACASGGYTYMDDPHLGISLTLTAESSGSVACTRYTNGYAYLGTFGITGDNNGAAVDISGRFAPALPAYIWNLGSYAISSTTYKFTRNTVPDGAYDQLKLKATILSEPDGVTFAGGSSSALSNATKLRYGRLRISNANGTTALALPVPVAAQYWDGMGFVTNIDDGCSTLPAPTLTFYGQTSDNQLAAGETVASYVHSPLSVGLAGLQLSAPGSSNFGYVDVGIDLSGLPWLRYNWDGVDQGGDSYLLDDNPRGRAIFGRRTGVERIIIRRELY